MKTAAARGSAIANCQVLPAHGMRTGAYYSCGGKPALLARSGVRVQVLCATRGEAGVPGLDPQQADLVREAVGADVMQVARGMGSDTCIAPAFLLAGLVYLPPPPEPRQPGSHATNRVCKRVAI